MIRSVSLLFLAACASQSQPQLATQPDPATVVDDVPTEAATPSCEDGATRPTEIACGLTGHRVEACVDGGWEPTDACDDTHPEDATLLETADGEGLSFQCGGPALDADGIIRRMPVGGDTWTPSATQNSGWTEHYLERYFRTCSDLTGCSEWRTSMLDAGAFWLLGFRLDAENQLHFVQEESEDAAGTPDAVLTPIDDGRSLVSLGLDWGFAENERFLVHAAEDCFSLSTLVHRTDDTGSTWTEEVWGLTTTWDWSLPPRPNRPAAPTLPEDACPQESTDPSTLAAAWFAPGSTYAPLGSHDWPRLNERWCTDLTGCTGWSFVDSLSYVTLHATDGLEIEITDERIEIESDGTFSSETYSGWVTPDCLRLEKHLDQTFDGRAARREFRGTMVIDAP